MDRSKVPLIEVDSGRRSEIEPSDEDEITATGRKSH
jgi:hypothetical protein